jgi:hypothetical protein
LGKGRDLGEDSRPRHPRCAAFIIPTAKRFSSINGKQGEESEERSKILPKDEAYAIIEACFEVYDDKSLGSSRRFTRNA